MTQQEPFRSDFELYLFDLDGTLIDSTGDIAAAVNQVRKQQDLSALTLDEVAKGIGHGASELIRHCFPQATMQQLYELREAFTQAYGSQLSKHTRPYPHAETLLCNLKKESKKIALVTNKPKRFAVPLLKDLAWSTHFDLCLFGDSLTERKPSSQPLIHAIQHFNVTPQHTLFIGDSEVDAQAALAAQTHLAIVSWGRAAQATKAGEYGLQAQVIELNDLYI